MSKLTDLQKQIIEEDQKKPDRTDEEIAVKLDCSASYVNKVRNNYQIEESENDGTGLMILIVLALIAIVWAAQNGLI